MAAYPDFITSTRYGHADGLKGINCRHDFFGVDPDIQPPNYTDEELAEIKRKEDTEHEYKTTKSNGKEVVQKFTPYEATQKQRSMERQMRRARALAKGYKNNGLQDDYKSMKDKYLKQLDEYENFSTAMGLKPNWSRIQMDGLGKI